MITLVLGAGSGHLLRGQYRRALGWLALTLALFALSGLTPIALWLGFLGTRSASAVDYWRDSGPQAALPSPGASFGSLLVYALLFLAVTEAYKSLLFQSFKVPGASMAPTLAIGDHIVANKLDTQPERGKVVVYVHPCNSKLEFVHRVVAIENDTVEIRCGTLFINGKALDQERIGESGEKSGTPYSEGDYTVLQDDDAGSVPSPFDFPGTIPPRCRGSLIETANTSQVLGAITERDTPPKDTCSPSRSYTVPEGHFFVMGDNRKNSSDSRIWGAVPNEAITGSLSYTYWSSGPAEP